MISEFYENEFSLDRKHILELKKILLNNKKTSTNKYWLKRQDLMKIKIDQKKNIIKISEESNLGNVIKKENFVFIKFIYFSILNKIVHKVFNNKNDNLYRRVQNLKLNLFYLINIKKIKFIENLKIKKALIEINELYPLKIWSLFILINKIEKLKNKIQLSKCIEIGSGPAVHVGFLNRLYGSKSIIVDLAIQKNIAFIFLKKFFPGVKINFYGYKKLMKKYKSLEKAFEFNDIIYIEPEYINKLPSNYFNYSINITAMQEMSKNDIKTYMNILQRILVPNNFFLSINRKKKILGKNKLFKFEDILCVNYKKILPDTFSYPKLNFDSSHRISTIKVLKKFENYFY